MKEVQIIKVSKDKVIRSGAIIKNKIRVVPYARVSTDSDEQKNSYESQKKYYQELVSNNPEWELVDIYADEAISGTQIYKRTDFIRMINDAMEGKIDMIITKSISRFARNTLDTLSYVRQLKEKGVAVFFEKENINTLTMNGELLLVILSSLAQQESESIGGNIKLGLKMKMSRGEMVEFNRCLGYSYDKDTKEISIRKSRNRIIDVEDNRRTKSRQHSFSCIIECAYCGNHFIRRTWHSSSKNEKHVWSCIKRTNTGRKYCPKSESIDEKTLEKCFVEVYNMLLDNHKEIIDNLTSTIEKIVLEEFDNSLIDNKNKNIKLIEKKISSLLDLGLESKIENTILESKMNEFTKDKCKLENGLNKLIEQRDSKENYNNRINDIKNKLNTLNRLECFDRQVFEYMISKIIIGKSDDNEKQYPLHITFVLKNDDEISGYTNSTNKKRSLNNARLDITRDTCRNSVFVRKK